MAVVAAAAALLPGCRGRVGTYREASVVLVTIDTLRADRLGAYGYGKGATPQLDALARESVVFDDAYANYPLTLPSHASLLTGLLPPRNGVRNNVGFPLAATHRTLATRLKAAGWKTGAAVSSFTLTRRTGISQGFDFYEDAVEGRAPEALNAPQRDGAVTAAALGDWIRNQKGARFFAWLHIYEPHSPYTPPDRFAKVGDPYDGEVAYADEIVGGFLKRLRDAHLLDRTLVVVASDHGEGLGEHGEDEHGIFLYRSTLHVPLMIRLPGGARGGTRAPGPTSLVDVAPTVLDLIGLDAPGLDGRSLRGELAGKPQPARRVYSETLYPRYAFHWSELRAATEGRQRFIQAPRPELYDLSSDPGETRDVSALQGATAAALGAWLTGVGGTEVPTPGSISTEAAERLRALGYVAGSVDPGSAKAAELKDPKDGIHIYADLKQGLTLVREGRHAEAVPFLTRVVEGNPEGLEAAEMLGEALARSGRPEEAVVVLEQALQRAPQRATMHLALVRLHVRAGRLEQAASQAEAASANAPGGGADVLAQLLMQKGDLAAAERFARASLAKNPKRAMAHFVLGVVEHKRRRFDRALESFRAAEANLAEGKNVKRLHSDIGDCLFRLGRLDEAEAEFRREIQLFPNAPEPRLGLAGLYRSKGRVAESRKALEDWISATPGADAEAYWLLVRMFLFLQDRETAATWSAIAREQFPTDGRFRGGEGSKAPAGPEGGAAPPVTAAPR